MKEKIETLSEIAKSQPPIIFYSAAHVYQPADEAPVITNSSYRHPITNSINHFVNFTDSNWIKRKCVNLQEYWNDRL